MKRKLTVTFPDSDGNSRQMPGDLMFRQLLRARIDAFVLHHDRDRLEDEILETLEWWDQTGAKLYARAASTARWRDHEPDPAILDVLTQAHLLLRMKGRARIGAERLFKEANRICQERGEVIDPEKKTVRARLTIYQAKSFLAHLQDLHPVNAPH